MTFLITNVVVIHQEEAELMVEKLAKHFQGLRKIIDHAEEQAMAIMEADKCEALQKIAKLQEQLLKDQGMLEALEEEIEMCSSDKSYFNFLLVTWIFGVITYVHIANME